MNFQLKVESKMEICSVSLLCSVSCFNALLPQPIISKTRTYLILVTRLFSRVRQFALQFSTGSRDISFVLIGQCENECFDFTTPSQNAHG